MAQADEDWSAWESLPEGLTAAPRETGACSAAPKDMHPKMKTPRTKTHRFSIAALSVLACLAFTVSTQATTFTVTTTADSGPGSLRQAILDANPNPGTDTITFNIPGAGPYTIQPLSPLPDITDPVVIDGYTQPGASPNALAHGDNAVLMIELDGSQAREYFAHGLHITAGNSTVRGLVINRWSYTGVFLDGSGGNAVEGNFIGTDVSGTVAQGNGFGVSPAGYPGSGILVKDSTGNRIGGPVPSARNVVSGNHFGMLAWFGGRNVIEGNFFGTGVTGPRRCPTLDPEESTCINRLTTSLAVAQMARATSSRETARSG
jgi:hypothetical protein